MAYTSCITNIAQSIQGSCDKPIVPGYTGRGVLIDLSKNPTWTVDAQNPRMITNVTMTSPAKFVAIDNVWNESFTGSNTASNADNGRPRCHYFCLVDIGGQHLDAAPRRHGVQSRYRAQ